MRQINLNSTKNLCSNFQSKPMSQTMILSLILLLLSSSFPTPSATTTQTLSAYQALQQYDFPIGLLPKGVTSYELNRETGEFAAYFNGSCSFTLEGSYKLKYNSKISGDISKDRLKNLKGVSVKILFFWISIVEVTRDNDELQFSVGIASASFPIDSFLESPQCGCGFSCVVTADRSSSVGSF